MSNSNISYRSTIIACNIGLFTQAVAINLIPTLFIPLKEQFGLSYGQLGMLVLINFITQLFCDIIFSNSADKHGFRPIAVISPLLIFTGLVLFAFSPNIFPTNPLPAFIISTIIFSAGSGLAEVVLSPIVNAIPTDEKIRAMSFLHASYCWGFVVVVSITTITIQIFSRTSWQYIMLAWSLLPLINAILFCRVPITEGVPEEKRQGMKDLIKNKYFIIFLIIIFAGGSAELSISQWASSFIEKGINLPKISGDILGVCGFAVMMGIGRTISGKLGSRLDTSKIMMHGNIVLVACIIIAAISPFSWLNILAIIVGGLAVSLQWPGTLMLAADFFPLAGAWMFAVLAAAGDIGASFAPWLLGNIADSIATKSTVIAFAQNLGITAEQFGLRTAMLFGSVFPLIGFMALLWYRYNQNK
ncbi:MAG: MFS transporter [Clostridia bacterium]|nr:MFS transporter [Clostridia bacterium]